MSARAGGAIGIELIRLHRVTRTLGFADVRLAAVHLRSLRVEESPDGTLRITPPERIDQRGRPWPLYALQPPAREAVEREIGRLWAVSV